MKRFFSILSPALSSVMAVSAAWLAAATLAFVIVQRAQALPAVLSGPSAWRSLFVLVGIILVMFVVIRRVPARAIWEGLFYAGSVWGAWLAGRLFFSTGAAMLWMAGAGLSLAFWPSLIVQSVFLLVGAVGFAAWLATLLTPSGLLTLYAGLTLYDLVFPSSLARIWPARIAGRWSTELVFDRHNPIRVYEFVAPLACIIRVAESNALAALALVAGGLIGTVFACYVAPGSRPAETRSLWSAAALVSLIFLVEDMLHVFV